MRSFRGTRGRVKVNGANEEKVRNGAEQAENENLQVTCARVWVLPNTGVNKGAALERIKVKKGPQERE